MKTYVFSPARHAFTDNFREVEDKVEFVALPATIYDAYQKVLPKRKENYLSWGLQIPSSKKQIENKNTCRLVRGDKCIE